ncbi:MAG: hypothetical protein GX452_12740 [Ignavibacteriales bacterium]|nr:hypothetical protein [Ignavibacteriales bacterium]
MSVDYIYNYLDDDDLILISDEIRNREKLTSAEIVLSIKRNISILNRLLHPRSGIDFYAKKEFYRLGADRTKDKTGILIFILFEERKFYVLADNAINQVFSQETWTSVTETIKTNFSQGMFAEGLVKSVSIIGEILENNFPIKPDDKNEISNKIIIT